MKGTWDISVNPQERAWGQHKTLQLPVLDEAAPALDTFTASNCKKQFSLSFSGCIACVSLKYKAAVYVWIRCRCSIFYETERNIWYTHLP